MKYIEIVKLAFGVILLSITSILGIIFLFESIGYSTKVIDSKNISSIFFYGENKNVLIFLGFCVIAGAYLLSSIKLKTK